MHDNGQSIRKDFSDNLKFEVGKGYGSKMVHRINLIGFGNQNNGVWVILKKDPTIFEELKHFITNILLDDFPISVIKVATKNNGARSTGFIEIGHNKFDFLGGRKAGENFVHTWVY